MAIKKQQLTVADTAVGFTVPSGIVPTKASFSLATGAIRIQLAGSTATSSAAMIITHAQGIVTITGNEAISNASMIRDGSDSGALDITYFDDYNGIEISGSK